MIWANRCKFSFFVQFIVVVLFLLIPGSPVGSQDCNQNEIDDAVEIENGDAQDCNENGVPDSCEIEVHSQFESYTYYPLSYRPSDLFVGEINGDGLDDLVVLHYETDVLHVHLSDQPGSYFPSFELTPVGPPDSKPAGIAFADFNSDGRIDLATGNKTSRVERGGLNLFLATAEGGFAPAIHFDTGQDYHSVHCVDVNNDSILDLILESNAPEIVTIAIADGEGSFESIQPIANLNWEGSLTVADVNNDDDPDVIFADYSGFRFGVFTGRGDGTFSDPIVYQSRVRARAIANGDINGDGNVDLVLLGDHDNNQGKAVLFTGSGNRHFEFREELILSSSSVKCEVYDLNSDGLDDIAIGQGGSLTVFLMENESSILPPIQSLGYLDHFGNINGDSYPDIVWLSSNRPWVQGAVLFNYGTPEGLFSNSKIYRSNEPGVIIDIVDIDNDDQLEIIHAAIWDRHLQVFHVDPVHGLVSDPPIYPVESDLSTLILIDLNLDEHLDLIAADSTREVLFVSLGDGEGGFGEKSEFPGFSLPMGIIGGDFNEDGFPDIAVCDWNIEGVKILRGDGTGSLSIGPVFATGVRPQDVKAYDFNKDGHLDLITANEDSDDVTLLFGNGDATFEPPYDYPVGNSPRKVELGDLDLDGEIDIVTANSLSNEVVILYGDSQGEFNTLQRVPLTFRTRDMVLTDFNNDGDLDIALLAVSHGGILAVDNKGSRQFELLDNYAFGSELNSISAIDLNGDRRPEILTSSYWQPGIGVLHNSSISQGEVDCNKNGVPDYCEIETGELADIDEDGVPDICQVDCDGNQRPDSYELIQGEAFDCNGNRTLDRCDIEAGVAFDCNNNGVPDSCDIRNGTSLDLNFDLLPDECGTDCNENGIPDDLDLERRTAFDCDRNGNLDSCDIQAGRAEDCDDNGIPDRCDATPDLQLTGFHRILSLESSIDDLYITDLNSDGINDLVMTFENTAMEIHLGLGDQHYARAQQFELPSRARSIDGGDFNGDGLVDIVIALDNTREFGVFTGLGNGQFNNPVLTFLGVFLSEVRAQDFNKDGLDDLAFSSHDRVVKVLISQEGQSFLEPFEIETDRNLLTLLIEDVNEDDLPDVIVLYKETAKGDVHRNNGNGTFSTGPTIDMPRFSLAAVGSDFNSDGISDLVTAHWGTDKILFHQGLGNSRFSESEIIQEFPFGRARQLTTGDFNGDLIPDLAAIVLNEDDSNDVRVWLCGLDGEFEAETPFTYPIMPRELKAVDINLDGVDDLVSHLGGSISILYGNKNSGFQVPRDNFIGKRVTHLTGSDTDTDGFVEYAVGNSQDREIEIFKMDSEFNSTRIQNIQLTDFPRELIHEDLDGDGRKDFIVVHLGLTVIWNNLPAPFSKQVIHFEGIGMDALAAATTADFDDDGLSELIVGDGNSERIFIFTNIGNKQFQLMGEVYSPFGVREIEVADFNGDDVKDLIVFVGGRDVSIYLFEGIIPGVFETQKPLFLEGSPISIAVEDFNGDQFTDIAVAYQSRPKMDILFGDAENSYSSTTSYLSTSSSGKIELTDLNRDGITDLLLTGGRGIDYFKGYGDGTFEKYLRYFVGEGARETIPVDLDKDDYPELLIADEGNELITALFNLIVPYSTEDCNGNGKPDGCDINSGLSLDIDLNGIPDECFFDCNEDGENDKLQIESGELADCNQNEIPDVCELNDESLNDCNQNGIPDSCELEVGLEFDCNENGVLDSCDVSSGTDTDCNKNGVLDSCERLFEDDPDLNGNGVPDICDPQGCKVPGDCNGDDFLDISDALCLFTILFIDGTQELPCGDGHYLHPANHTLLDWQGDKKIDLSDPISLLRFLFVGQARHILAIPGDELAGCVPILDCPE